ncbi:hypothetical protein [Streptomyces sp. NPDC091299]|uniref:hypothetical protein n=1 Tax=Streptomyces sp. NPDC091299 TaxID=3155302 RepID=UPI003418B2C5
MSTDGRLRPNSQAPAPVDGKFTLPSPEELGRSVHSNGSEPIVETDNPWWNWRPEVIDGGGDRYVRIRRGERFQRLDGSTQQLDRMRARHENRIEVWKFVTGVGISVLLLAGCLFGGLLKIPTEAQTFLYVSGGSAMNWVFKTVQSSQPGRSKQQR